MRFKLARGRGGDKCLKALMECRIFARRLFERLNMGPDCVNSASCADVEKLQEPFVIAWCSYYEYESRLFYSPAPSLAGTTWTEILSPSGNMQENMSRAICEMDDRFLASCNPKVRLSWKMEYWWNGSRLIISSQYPETLGCQIHIYYNIPLVVSGSFCYRTRSFPVYIPSFHHQRLVYKYQTNPHIKRY